MQTLTSVAELMAKLNRTGSWSRKSERSLDAFFFFFRRSCGFYIEGQLLEIFLNGFLLMIRTYDLWNPHPRAGFCQSFSKHWQATPIWNTCLAGLFSSMPKNMFSTATKNISQGFPPQDCQYFQISSSKGNIRTWPLVWFAWKPSIEPGCWETQPSNLTKCLAYNLRWTF